MHMTAGSVLPGYSLVSARVPDSLVEELPESELPRSWRAFPVLPEVQAIGDAWVRSGRALALRVPSVIVEGSHNVLINPEHTAFARLAVESVRPFAFDPR